MTPAPLTADEMRALERAAIDSGAVTGSELMGRAGRGAVDAIRERWPDLGRATVLCGPGNNGGDGFVIARLLRDGGCDVAVHLFRAPDKLPPDARANHDRWAATAPVGRIGTDAVTPETDLWVDAMFGIGQTRALPEEVVAVLASARDSAAPLVAVDVPSGLASDTGEVLQTFRPGTDLTVTFHGPKPGHLTGAGPECCGKVVVVDIGL